MTATAETEAPWHIVGCGRMGGLAARYLHAAGWPVVVVRDTSATVLRLAYRDADGRALSTLELPVRPPRALPTISRLLVATKTPFTAKAIASLTLSPEATVLRLQNGIGSLDGLLPAGCRPIEVVTASAVKSAADGALTVVAENETVFGGTPAPAWWPALQARWPQADWQTDIGPAQRAKLAVNAVLNPLTALYDVDNGALLERADMAAEARHLAAETDAILSALDADWPGNTLERVYEIAGATAANMSSMRADLRAGAATEISAINGWLVDQAARLGLATPAHTAIIARIRARSP